MSSRRRQAVRSEDNVLDGLSGLVGVVFVPALVSFGLLVSGSVSVKGFLICVLSSYFSSAASLSAALLGKKALLWLLVLAVVLLSVVGGASAAACVFTHSAISAKARLDVANCSYGDNGVCCAATWLSPNGTAVQALKLVARDGSHDGRHANLSITVAAPPTACVALNVGLVNDICHASSPPYVGRCPSLSPRFKFSGDPDALIRRATCLGESVPFWGGRYVLDPSVVVTPSAHIALPTAACRLSDTACCCGPSFGRATALIETSRLFGGGCPKTGKACAAVVGQIDSGTAAARAVDRPSQESSGAGWAAPCVAALASVLALHRADIGMAAARASRAGIGATIVLVLLSILLGDICVLLARIIWFLMLPFGRSQFLELYVASFGVLLEMIPGPIPPSFFEPDVVSERMLFLVLADRTSAAITKATTEILEEKRKKRPTPADDDPAKLEEFSQMEKHFGYDLRAAEAARPFEFLRSGLAAVSVFAWRAALAVLFGITMTAVRAQEIIITQPVESPSSPVHVVGSPHRFRAETNGYGNITFSAQIGGFRQQVTPTSSYMTPLFTYPGSTWALLVFMSGGSLGSGLDASRWSNIPDLGPEGGVYGFGQPGPSPVKTMPSAVDASAGCDFDVATIDGITYEKMATIFAGECPYGAVGQPASICLARVAGTAPPVARVHFIPPGSVQVNPSFTAEWCWNFEGGCRVGQAAVVPDGVADLSVECPVVVEMPDGSSHCADLDAVNALGAVAQAGKLGAIQFAPGSFRRIYGLATGDHRTELADAQAGLKTNVYLLANLGFCTTQTAATQFSSGTGQASLASSQAYQVVLDEPSSWLAAPSIFDVQTEILADQLRTQLPQPPASSHVSVAKHSAPFSHPIVYPVDTRGRPQTLATQGAYTSFDSLANPTKMEQNDLVGDGCPVQMMIRGCSFTPTGSLVSGTVCPAASGSYTQPRDRYSWMQAYDDYDYDTLRREINESSTFGYFVQLDAAVGGSFIESGQTLYSPAVALFRHQSDVFQPSSITTLSVSLSHTNRFSGMTAYSITSASASRAAASLDVFTSLWGQPAKVTSDVGLTYVAGPNNVKLVTASCATRSDTGLVSCGGLTHRFSCPHATLLLKCNQTPDGNATIAGLVGAGLGLGEKQYTVKTITQRVDGNPFYPATASKAGSGVGTSWFERLSDAALAGIVVAAMMGTGLLGLAVSHLFAGTQCARVAQVFSLVVTLGLVWLLCKAAARCKACCGTPDDERREPSSQPDDSNSSSSPARTKSTSKTEATGPSPRIHRPVSIQIGDGQTSSSPSAGTPTPDTRQFSSAESPAVRSGADLLVTGGAQEAASTSERNPLCGTGAPPDSAATRPPSAEASDEHGTDLSAYAARLENEAQRSPSTCSTYSAPDNSDDGFDSSDESDKSRYPRAPKSSRISAVQPRQSLSTILAITAQSGMLCKENLLSWEIASSEEKLVMMQCGPPATRGAVPLAVIRLEHAAVMLGALVTEIVYSPSDDKVSVSHSNGKTVCHQLTRKPAFWAPMRVSGYDPPKADPE